MPVVASSQAEVLLLLETQVFELGTRNPSRRGVWFNSALVNELFQIVTTNTYGPTTVADAMARDLSRRNQTVHQRTADLEDHGHVLDGEQFHRESRRPFSVIESFVRVSFWIRTMA